MPVVEEAQRESRRVSFAPESIDSREENPLPREDQQQQDETTSAAGIAETETASPIFTLNDANIDDGTGKKFKIPFQEHRLRFDQKFPEGLNLRIPESEYEIVLEKVHRELIEPIEKSQKSVRKWSALVAGTAPVGVGFVLSIFLARRVNRHQKALKNFWLSLRNHLKALNRDIYYARGIEWRIERDSEKIAEREAHNKLLSFRMEIIFRRPITLRSGREMALHSVIEPDRASSIVRSSISSASRTSKFFDNYLADPTLLSLLTTAPGGEENFYSSMEDEAAGVGATDLTNGVIQEEDETGEELEIYSSPFLIPDHMALADSSVNEADLILKVDEPAEVAQARVMSVFEPPSPTPTGSVFTEAAEDFNATKKMTFADLLRSSIGEDQKSAPVDGLTPTGTGEESSATSPNETNKMSFADLLRSSIEEEEKSSSKSEIEGSNATGVAVAAGAAGVVGVTAAMAAASLDRSPSPSQTTPALLTAPAPFNSTRESREEAFAQRQRKKFSRDPTAGTQLYDIPESPKLGAGDDPAGDAMNYLNASEDEDMIEDILGNRAVSFIPENFEPKPVVNAHFEDVGPVPVAAYPMADPFSPLYETDQVTPVDPPIETDEDLEYTDVDGEVEYVRRKKWRVAPENAGKLSRVQTMSESIHPSSRRSSYLPLTTTRNMPTTINFDGNE